MKKTILPPFVKSLLDYLPLGIFLITFKWLGIYYATAFLMATTLASVLVLFVFERRVAFVPLVTALIVGVMGGLSLWLHDEAFIKMKPTVVYSLFALILLGGCLRGKGMLAHVMGSALELTDRGWWQLSLRFGLFFVGMALLNEFVWRTMPTDWWVNFKVFGGIGLMVLFSISQAGFIERSQKAEKTSV